MSWWMTALAFAVPGVPAAVFAAACAGLWLVARTCGQKAKRRSKRRWRDARDAWRGARDALRDARAELKNAAAELAAGKRRLKRERKAAGKQSSPAAIGGGSAQAAVLEEVRQAVDDADRTLTGTKQEARRRRDALAAARRDLRECATASCRAWQRLVLEKSRRTVRRARREGLERFRSFLSEYFVGGLWGLKDLLNEYYYPIAASLTTSLVPTLAAVFVDLAYYRQFHLNALPFYASASLPALASTVLMMVAVIVLSFAGFLVVVAFLFVGVRALYWVLILAAAVLARALLVVLSPLPLLVSQSALCARLAAPGPESGAR